MKRVTITSKDGKLTFPQMSKAADMSVKYWDNETAKGEYWCPGSVLILEIQNGPNDGMTIATSTRRTKSGYCVACWIPISDHQK